MFVRPTLILTTYTLYESLLLSRSVENEHSIKMDSSVLKIVAPKIGLIEEFN
jgi:hypothetical protein